MNGILVYVLLFILLLLVSAFLSGAETAFFRLQSRIKDFGEEQAIHPGIQALLEKPRHLLISLLTGNTLVNVAMAFVAALFTANLAKQREWNLPLLLVAESIIVTIIVLLFGEIMPKLLAIRRTETFARTARGPAGVLVIVLYPIGSLIYGLTRLVARMLGIHREEIFTSEEELKDLAEVGVDRGTLARSETEIIHSIFEFTDTAVHEIMTPRVDIRALEAQAGLPEALELIRTRQISRIPVYKETVDDIRGILHAKDLLPYLEGSIPEVSLLRLARPPFFVPETKGVVALMENFRNRRTNMAIVVDEFGGTAGLVTLEDVVEEVLGELRDPFDQEEVEIQPLGADEYLVDAAVALDDLGDRINCEFPEERDYDTLGGFLFDRFDRIPAVGQSVNACNRRFTVKALEGNRIGKVHIEPVETVRNEDHDEPA